MAKKLLGANNLTIKYRRQGLVAVDGFSFALEKGEKISLFGPSGCGKTTILNVLSGIIRESESEVTGEINKAKGLKIFTVFQEPRLLPWLTVLQNAAFGATAQGVGKEEAERTALRLLEVVGLTEHKDLYPRELSGGMKQRVNFIRAIAAGPDVLFLDEPFSSIDTKTKKQIEEDFLRLIDGQKISVLFVTHNKEEAIKLTDKIIYLSKRPAKVERIYNKKDFDKIGVLEYEGLYA